MTKPLVRRLLLVGGVALVLVLIAGIALLARGASEVPAARETSASPTTPSTITLTVTVTTSNGLIAPNHDDTYCVWRELEYVLRDAAGTIVASERKADSGASVGDSRWAAAGVVTSREPYGCELTWPVTAPWGDFWQIEVRSVAFNGSTHRAEAPIRRTEAKVSLVLD